MTKQRSRKEILKNIKKVVGNNHNEDKVKSRIVFCPNCGNNITINNPAGSKNIICFKCKYEGERAFIFDEDMQWEFNDNHSKKFNKVPAGELIHFSVGAKIEGRNNSYLLLRRTLYPTKNYTIPAGHLEKKDKDINTAVIREILEETGIDINSNSNPKPQEIGIIKDPCRRGADYHFWYLSHYKIEDYQDIKLCKESDIIGFYSRKEMESLSLAIPTRNFLRIYDRIRISIMALITRKKSSSNSVQFLLIFKLKGPSKNSWDLIGGGLNPDEKIYDALIRETKEETGINIRLNKIPKDPLLIEEEFFPDWSDKGMHCLSIIYKYQLDNDELDQNSQKNRDDKEGSLIEWKGLEELKTIELSDRAEKALKKAGFIK